MMRTFKHPNPAKFKNLSLVFAALAIILSSSAIIGTFNPAYVSAAPAATTSAPAPVTIHRSPIQPGLLPKTPANSSSVKAVLQIFFGILGAFALLVITIAGMSYITSAGDPQKVTNAKNAIIYAIVGLVIAITAESIVSFLVDRV